MGFCIYYWYIECQCLNINSLQFSNRSDLGLLVTKIKIITHLTCNNTMISLGININILNINNFILSSNNTQKIIFSRLWPLTKLKLLIRSYSPSIHLIIFGYCYSCLLRYCQFLYLLVTANTWYLYFFEGEYLLLLVYSLLETFFIDVGVATNDLCELLIIYLLVLMVVEHWSF